MSDCEQKEINYIQQNCSFCAMECEPYPDCNIDELNLSKRSINGLKRAGYLKASQICNLDKEHLMSIKNLGKQSINEIIDIIDSYIIYNAKSTMEQCSNPVLREAIKRKIFNLLLKHEFGFDENYVFDIFPNNTINDNMIREIINEMKTDNIIVVNENIISIRKKLYH